MESESIFEMELKYFSTFSGIGGFELGIDNKAECIGFSEIDKYAIEIYKKHFSGHKNYGDITTINVSELPDFDLLVGGFPCQSFSIAGKRKGFEDTRGTLFFDLARILQAKQPELFIFENVKGLLSHDNGQTFKTIIATLTELGYDLQWQVLNSKNFGVPQNRERVFIVGHLGGFGGRQVFPIGKSNAILNKDNKQKLAKSMTSTMPPIILRGRPKMPYENGKRKLEYKIYDKIVPTISTNCGSGDQKNMVMQGGGRQPKIIGGLQKHQTPREDGNSPALVEAMGQGGGHIPKVLQIGTRKDSNSGQQPFQQDRVYDVNGISPALQQALPEGGHKISVESKIRRLTPTECERLQGFPDGWTEGISDSQRYKCLGNAVTVNVISEIIKKMHFHFLKQIDIILVLNICLY